MGMEIRALSVEEAAKAAGVGRTLLYEHIHSGRLTARKAGRRTIITVDALDAWLQSLPTSTGLHGQCKPNDRPDAAPTYQRPSKSLANRSKPAA
jgi:excisionase family DNA binding protein